jgi:biotin carboxyl carrier protein
VRFDVSRERVVARGDGNRAAGRATIRASGVEVVFDAQTYDLAFGAPPASGAVNNATARGGRATVVSPMPGKIVKVAVAPGDIVVERDLLLVLEAMKMEHRIEAARSGTVKSVAVHAGSLVGGGATLMEFEG